MKKKKIILSLVIIILIIGSYYLLFVNNRTEKKEETTKQEEISKSDLIIKELTNKYQVTTSWEENLTYTLQAQERLITNKPILFRGNVDDVFSRDGKTFILFSSSYMSSADYVLELECNKQIVDKIFAEKENNKDYLGFFDEYILIANIQEVSKPALALKGSVLSEDNVEINIESSKLFTAKGYCVDIAYIGNDELFKD